MTCLRSVVSYFNKNGNTVNIACLDISKAFDKVCHSSLFLKLINRGCPKTLIAILYNWYGKCVVSVRWNHVFSDNFSVHAGIRHGGITSPCVFAIYLDNLTTRLCQSKFGCSTGNNYFGCLLYADDIILLSVTLCLCRDYVTIYSLCAENVRHLC